MNYLFLGIMLSVYGGLHLFLYFSTIYLFSISSLKIKVAILALYGFLAISFFLSFIFARFSDNLFGQIIYYISASWVGLLIYLILFLLLSCLLAFIFKNYYPNLKIILAGISVILSLGLVIYGIIAAQNPKLTELNISLKNLPEQWKNKSIVQLSDLHLGKIQNHKFFDKIINTINQIKPDLIFITGDLFDGIGNSHHIFMEQLSSLRATHGVFFVTGNHESYLGTEQILNELKATGIIILDNELIEIDGLQIIGLSFTGFEGEQDKDIIKNLPNFDSEKSNILLYHEPVAIGRTKNLNGNGHSELYFGPKTDFTVQKENGIDLQLSGHTHAGQLWPFTWLTKKIYKGFHYGLFQDGDFQLYVSSGTGTWGPPVRLGSQSEIVQINLK